MMRRREQWTLAALLVATLAAPAFSRTHKTMEAALAEVFPDARVERRTVYLTDKQRKSIEKKAGVSLPSAVIYPYEIFEEDRRVAVVYFDVHRVRTRSQTLMVAAHPDGTVRHAEALAFEEPAAYRPRAAWYESFRGHRLNKRLKAGAGIDAVTGATITSRATVSAVRRVLAVHGELYEAVADADDAGSGSATQ